MKTTISEMMEEAFNTNVEHGFDPANVPLPTAIALIHSELSEALESYRKNERLYYYDWDKTVVAGEWCGEIPKPEGVGAEYADAIIRMFSDAYARGIPLEMLIHEKMLYNKYRPHKHGGKKI